MNAGYVALGVVGIAATGFGVWYIMKKNQNGSEQMMVPGPGASPQQVNAQLLQQPGVAYPYAAPEPQRNQTQTQPWYGGSQAGLTQNPLPGGPDSSFAYLTQYVSGANQIAQDLSSLWDTFGGWFEGSDPTMNFIDGSTEIGSIDWGSFA